MAQLKEKTKRLIKTVLEFCLNPKLLLCFGIAWLLTNGWSYIMLSIGTWLDIKWMMAVSGAYMAALWIPFTPEKIITVIIAIALLRLFFPNDQKTLKKLKDLKQSAKSAWKKENEKLKNWINKKT